MNTAGSIHQRLSSCSCLSPRKVIGRRELEGLSPHPASVGPGRGSLCLFLKQQRTLPAGPALLDSLVG